MAFATTNRVGMWYIPEVTWGLTPVSGNLTEVRYTGESLNANLETQVSDEIRSDRATSDLVPVGQAAGGGLDIEMSVVSFDDFLESGFFDTFSTQLAIVGVAADISTVNATSKITSTTLTKFDGILVGQWIELRGFIVASGENNGFYQVTVAVDGSGELTLAQAPPSDETPAGITAEVHGSMLRNGVTPKSFTLEKRINDATPVTYQHFAGSIVASMKLDFEVGSILKGAFDFLSKDGPMTETALPGLTEVPQSTTDVLNSVNNLSEVRIDDVASTLSFLKLGMEIGNNLRGQKAIGSLANVGIGSGSIDMTGPIEYYFADKTEFDKFNGNTAFKLSFLIQDAAGNGYMFTFPKIKYEGLTSNADSKNNDMIGKGTWRGLLDPTTSSMMQIDRFLA